MESESVIRTHFLEPSSNQQQSRHPEETGIATAHMHPCHQEKHHSRSQHTCAQPFWESYCIDEDCHASSSKDSHASSSKRSFIFLHKGSMQGCMSMISWRPSAAVQTRMNLTEILCKLVVSLYNTHMKGSLSLMVLMINVCAISQQHPSTLELIVPEMIKKRRGVRSCFR